MEIVELYRLANWFTERYSEITRAYNAVLEPINHNASQPDKQPIDQQLNTLVDILNSQRFDELSLQQLKMLESLGVDAYIGHEGALYAEASVRTSDYDPRTASQRLTSAVQAITNARTLLSNYADTVRALSLDDALAEPDEERITIRVGFQNDVAINNVTDWKDTAKEWYDIIRGVAMACDEKPEDVKVTGAATGSIILIMAGTATFAYLLAKISKHLTSVSKDIIGVRMAMEDLRQKGLLTKAMESEFKKMEKEKADGAVVAVGALLEDKLAGKDGEIKTALTKSIEKLLTFSEKGGTVDFVAPDEPAEPGDDGDDDDGGLRLALIEARAAIQEFQAERESLKLLSDGTKAANG